MAKIKYMTKGVERKGSLNVPKPGVYRCKVISAIDASPAGKNRRLELQYEIAEGDNKGYRLYDYIPLIESMDWKLAQFVDAMGLPENGSMDLDELVGTGLNVRVRVENSEQYGASAKPATLMPLDGDEPEEDLSEGDGDEGEEDGEEEDETYSREELDELSKEDLFAVADEVLEEYDKPNKLTAKAKKTLIDAILEAQDEDGEEEEDEEEDEEDGDEEELWTEEELTELDDDELTEQAKEYEVDLDDHQKTVGKGKAKKTKLDRDGVIAAILEAQGEEDEDDEEEGDEEEEETPDYNEMDLAALKALCVEREINPKGSKKLLITRLEKDDQPF